MMQGNAKWPIRVLLMVLLGCAYLLTYSSHIESGDAQQYFDAVSSQVRFGDWLLDESWWQGRSFYTPSNGPLPLNELDTERLLPLAAAPLYLLAEILPNIGYLQAVWLFNVLVSMATCVLLFDLVLALRYDLRTAALTALALGLCTLVWPYSKTFFRGPLVMLCIMGAAYALLLWRQGGYLAGWRAALRLLIALACIVAAILTKISGLFAIPALLLIALPDVPHITRQRWFVRLSDVALLLGIAGTALIVYTDWGFALFEALLQAQPVFSLDTAHIRTALHAYLFSLGGSVWGTSPILLLGLYGAWRWLSARPLHNTLPNGSYAAAPDRPVYGPGRRWVWAAFLLLGAYAFGHALPSGVHWFGGLSWPPRFLLPVMPLLVLLIAPALANLKARWVWALALLLAVYSLWVQFNAVAMPLGLYSYTLPPESNGLLEWSPGLNSVQYLRWVLLPTRWPSVAFDFAWVRAGYPAFGLALSTLFALSAGLLAWRLRTSAKAITHEHRPPARLARWALRLLPLAFTGVGLLGLWALYADDGLSWGHKQALHDAFAVLREEAQAGDVVVLADPTYHRFVLNYNDLRHVRVIILEPQPGESPSPQQPPQVTGDYPAALLTRSTPLTLDHLITHHERIWLLVANSDFTPWAVRPVERYLAERTYLRRNVPLTPDPTVRLLEFSTRYDHNPYALYNPLHPSGLHYGDHITLRGYQLPGGTHYAPAAMLPISLQWQTDTALTQSYNSGWFLVHEASGTVAVHGSGGQDQPPGAGFAQTDTWQSGQPVWDNRALRLPAEIAPGTYVLWVTLYATDAAGDIQHLTVRGGESALDGRMGVLPTRIVITQTGAEARP